MSMSIWPGLVENCQAVKLRTICREGFTMKISGAKMLISFGLVLWVAASFAWGGVGPAALEQCSELAYSTEEDFVTRCPEPPDGNPIISDGDLLGRNCVVCARNSDLLAPFDVSVDIGLDAVDVIDAKDYLVAFSTELDSPNAGQFYAGDLLVTNGALIPNRALTFEWKVGYDLGLDAVHFVGDASNIRAFLNFASQYSRDDWLQIPDLLWSLLSETGSDIWFSTEGTFSSAGTPVFLDGDLLSARDGYIVSGNDELLGDSVPAGIPIRGVDFGLDAVAAGRDAGGAILFSTEILLEGEPSFSDGDVLSKGGGVVIPHYELVHCFEPTASFVGLDALWVSQEQLPASDLGDAPDSTNHMGANMMAYPGVVASYPTVFDAAAGLVQGPKHLEPLEDAWLGGWVTLENEADIFLDQDGGTNISPADDAADRDGADDAVELPIVLRRCQATTFTYTVTVPTWAARIERYVNVWFDWNRDGDWDDSFGCFKDNDAPEWAVQNQVLPPLEAGTYVFSTPIFLPWNVPNGSIRGTWMRISIAEAMAPFEGDGRGPAGGYSYGETEDFYLPQPCDGCADYDLSGSVDTGDLGVLVDNWLWAGPVGGFNDGDLDCDGDVEFRDYAILALQWLKNCP
jgi:hypothetical protein